MAEQIDKQQLYQLIIAQLHHDGYIGLAETVSRATLTPTDTSIPKGRLESLVRAGSESVDRAAATAAPVLNIKEIKGIDLDQETGNEERETAKVSYDTYFIATHKFACISATFSPDGSLAATGSQDNTVKLIDVRKITTNQNKSEDGTSVRAVICTFYGHTHRISGLGFHPTLPILASSSDNSIKFHDLKDSNKKVKKELKDTHSIRSIKFHPSGDFILVGTEHHYVRLYDYGSRNSYISSASEQQNQHQLAINEVDVTRDGRMFSSCSEDGTIKLWDGRTLGCMSTWERAHSGLPVLSARFSKNGKYILSSGEDHVVRLWDITAGKTLHTFKKTNPKFRCNATFSYDERLVIIPDEANGVYILDTLTHGVAQQLAGHSNGVRCIAASPVDSTLITCSEDSRARFWVDSSKIDFSSTL